MDSMPPATARSYSPAMIALPTPIAARMPDPHTLWTVTQGTELGMPAARDACRAGACPCPACRTLPRTTASIRSAGTAACASAPRIAAAPRAEAGRAESFPKKEPTGVRDAPRRTTFFMTAILTAAFDARFRRRTAKLPPAMPRILAVDFGEKRIGLATSDPAGLLATPRRTLARKGDAAAIAEILAFCAQEEVQAIL